MHRRGTVYLAVLGVAMIVSIIGMISMQLARLQLRSTQNLQDLEEARVLAESGVEFGMGNMDYLDDWRTDMTSGVEFDSPIAVGGGTMSYMLVDDDGDLADDTTDPVRILGIGRVGEATYVASVQLEPAGTGLTCLEVAMHAGSFLELKSKTTDCDQTISSNLDVKNSGATVNADIEAVGNIDGSFNGTTTTGITPRSLPSTSNVFDYYITNGQVIDFDSIPSAKLQDLVLSPESNPFGTPAGPLGIYVIDCQGSKLEIRDVRIVGTLVLLNASSGATFKERIHWEPAVANYPALMVQGDFSSDWKGDENLSEPALGVNFNPPGTPYEGDEDSDQLDEYPPIIKGLVYVSGNLEIKREFHLQGTVVVGGDILVDDNLELTYDATLLSNPPPGFASGDEMQLVPGTWQRAASD